MNRLSRMGRAAAATAAASLLGCGGQPMQFEPESGPAPRHHEREVEVGDDRRDLLTLPPATEYKAASTASILPLYTLDAVARARLFDADSWSALGRPEAASAPAIPAGSAGRVRDLVYYFSACGLDNVFAKTEDTRPVDSVLARGWNLVFDLEMVRSDFDSSTYLGKRREKSQRGSAQVR